MMSSMGIDLPKALMGDLGSNLSFDRWIHAGGERGGLTNRRSDADAIDGGA
jgi:hypothetical protein